MARYKTRIEQPTTRDPQPETREPVQRKPRHYIPASMPTVCPACGHNTRMADGRHVDPVRRNILEYRTCCHCGKKLAAGRPMTPVEIRQHCGLADAVAEYECDMRG
jgi:hypothetical protein